MVGQRRRPEELRETISQLIRYEMQSLPTAAMGRIKQLDEETRRATIETVPDGATESNVPVATPFAADGEGDLAPLNPKVRDQPVRGIILYLHHPIEQQLTSMGFSFDGERDHDESNAIFLPAMVWTDDEQVPDHDPDERAVSHQEGNKLSLTDEKARVEHHLGAALEILGSPEEEPEGEAIINEERDPAEEWGDEPDAPDNTSWPIAEGQDETAGRLSHPTGPAVTTVERGISLENDGREVAAGPFNDGDRQPVAGPFQHFHLQTNADGTKSLIGPQLSFREFIAWMTDPDRQSQLTNADAYDDARKYANNYLDWLEEQVGREINPVREESWPDPEPMPTHEQLAEFMPAPVHITPAAATATADAPVPAIDVDFQHIVSAPVATTTVDAPAPRVGAFSIVDLSAPTATATASAPVPSVTTTYGYGEAYGEDFGG